MWDWTSQGSLASKEVEQQLFSLPAGGVSPPIVRKDRVEIVRVLERKEGGRKPFESVQKEIEEKLTQDVRQKAVQDGSSEESPRFVGSFERKKVARTACLLRIAAMASAGSMLPVSIVR